MSTNDDNSWRSWLPWNAGPPPPPPPENLKSFEAASTAVDQGAQAVKDLVDNLQHTAHVKFGSVNDQISRAVTEPIDYVAQQLASIWPSSGEALQHQIAGVRDAAKTGVDDLILSVSRGLNKVREAAPDLARPLGLSEPQNVQAAQEPSSAYDMLTNVFEFAREKAITASEYSRRFGESLHNGNAASASSSATASDPASTNTTSSWSGLKPGGVWSDKGSGSKGPSAAPRQPSAALKPGKGVVRRRPAFFWPVIGTLAASAVLYLYPETFLWSVSGVINETVRRLPAWFNRFAPVKTVRDTITAKDHRKRRLTNGDRHEAVLVLGADSHAGTNVALHLESRGFVVIATVRSSTAVRPLEDKSLHRSLKVLVLDPADHTASPQAFARSLSTCLSLRYPLNDPGDPYAGTNAANLVALVNLWPLQAPAHDSQTSPLDTALALYNERVVSFNATLRVVLPFIRQGVKRPNSPEAVILTASRAATAYHSLPSYADVCAADHALMSFLASLSRDLNPAQTRIATVSLDVSNAKLSKDARLPETVARIILRDSRQRIVSLDTNARLYRLLGQILPASLVDAYLSAVAHNVPPSHANRLGHVSVMSALSPKDDEDDDALTSSSMSLVPEDEDLISSIDSFVGIDGSQ